MHAGFGSQWTGFESQVPYKVKSNGGAMVEWKDTGFSSLKEIHKFASQHLLSPSAIQTEGSYRFFTTDEGCVIAQSLDGGPVKEKCPEKPLKTKKKPRKKQIQRKKADPPWNTSKHNSLSAVKAEWNALTDEEFDVLESIVVYNRGHYYVYIELDSKVLGKILK